MSFKSIKATDELITSTFSTAKTVVVEGLGLVEDTFTGVRKPVANAFKTIGNYSEVTVQDSELYLKKNTLINKAKLSAVTSALEDEKTIKKIQEAEVAKILEDILD